MTTTNIRLSEKHTLFHSAVFAIKSYLLIGIRSVNNAGSPIKRFKQGSTNLVDAAVIATSESPLWNPFDTPENWLLTAGKIENLRVASNYLNGLEINPNELFSFWKHIGKPSRRKGYVVGREIREGCIVPTIAGGLCQLSNALYDAALKAGLEIVERHKHTKVIKGSLAEKNRDATVKWNYIDLRFKSTAGIRIEVELTTDKLIVVFKSKQKQQEETIPTSPTNKANALNDCYSCGNTSCFKHQEPKTIRPNPAITTFVLDEKWPEYDDYVKNIAQKDDYVIYSLKSNKFIKAPRYSWTINEASNQQTTQKEGIYRALFLRFFSGKYNPFDLSLQLDKKIALRAAQKIPLETTHLVIAQNLLPFMHQTGVLGGRTFDILMTRLPMKQLHERLDTTYEKHRNSPTLNDFRAPNDIVNAETTALKYARKIITPHTDIARIFNNKVTKIEWNLPENNVSPTKGKGILFPASALGRKGAYEMRQLAKELDVEVIVLGNKLENNDFWQGVKVKKFDGNFEEIGLIIYPTYIEHQPRQLLKAISKGIPIITTTACGLDSSEKVTVLEAGNINLLREAIYQQLQG